MRAITCVGLALMLTAPALLRAQDTLQAQTPRADTLSRMDLPREAAEQLIEYFNDPRTIHFSGPTRIPAKRTIVGDVAVLNGPLTVAGRIEGRVAVLNGDVELLPGALISDEVMVVGGTVRGLDEAHVGGEVLVYSEPLRYRRRGDRITRIGGRDEDGEGPAEEGSEPWGWSDFTITTGKSYNRVEGLPITFGPQIQTQGSNPLRVQALGIYRSESGVTLDPDQMGYYVRAEQFLGGHHSARVGVTAHSLVDPIEDWHLTDLENSLATFFFHHDYRDHYERQGVSAFAALEPEGAPYALRAEARWEEHHTRPAGSPWALFNNAEEWRPQPLIAEGDVSYIVLRAMYDTRSQAADPATGWHLEARYEQSMDSDLVRRGAFAAGPLYRVLPSRSYDGFTTGMVDLRRYNRVDPTSRLNFRFIAGGSLNGSPLPPQRQHVLGGEGSLPGYDFFSRDCGARTEVVYRTEVAPAERALTGPQPAAFFPRYGCDVFALLQAEYRGSLSFRFRWDADPWRDEGSDEDDREWKPGWELSPDWAVFVDAGRGWTLGRGTDTELAVDLGVGLLLDPVGIYLAAPLTGAGGVNFFVRLEPRF